MPNMELHRGRLVDHIQLVVADLAFQAKDRATVDKFYEAGVAAGGRDEGSRAASGAFNRRTLQIQGLS